jgi:hypothetical protein
LGWNSPTLATLIEHAGPLTRERWLAGRPAKSWTDQHELAEPESWRDPAE